MRKKISIACFTGDSGLTDYSVSLSRAIKKFSDVELITSTAISPSFNIFNVDINKMFHRSRHYIFDFPLFVFYVFKDRPSCILFQSYLRFPLLEGVAISFFKVFGIKTALTIHDVLPHYPKPWSKYVFGWFYQRFDKLIVHSNSSYDAIKKLGITKPILVVPHGVYDIFKINKYTKTLAKESLNIADADFSVIFFGHLEPRKGLMEFINVAKELETIPNLKFIIAGDNGLSSHGPEYVVALDACRSSKNIIVHDYKIPFEEVEKYFMASDLVALPYKEGTTSGVLKLAIAFGVPVIASDVGDFKEQVSDDVGILFPAGRDMKVNIRNSIIRMLHEHEKYAEKIKLVSSMYRWDVISKKYYDFLFSEEVGE